MSRSLVRPAGILAPVLVIAGCLAVDESASGDLDVRVVDEEAVQVLGTSETIARIADVQPGPDGLVWVLNTVEPFFLALDASGAVVRSLGRQGGGPDEFREPNTLIGDTAASAVWAYDRAAHTLVRVSDGEASRLVLMLSRDSLPADRITTNDFAGPEGGRYWIRPSSNGFLFARARAGAQGFRELWTTDIVEHGRDETVRPVFSPADHLSDPTALFGDASEFLPFPLMDTCDDGSVALYDPVVNAVALYRVDESVVRTDSLPPPRNLEITPERLFSLVYATVTEIPGIGTPDSVQVMTMLRLEWPQISAEMGPVFPEYVDLHCTGGGTVWIQPIDVENGQFGRGPGWLRLNGEVMERFELPASFRPLRFTSGRIWGVLRGEYDVESVAWLDPDGA